MKNILSLTLIALFLMACGDKDKQTLLKELQAKRDNLNTQIYALKSELAEERSNAEEVKKVVQLQQITPSPFHHFIKIQGTVESDNNILIPAQSPGVVKKIYVSEGDQVKKGQLLAELDGSILEKTIQELNTNLVLATTVYERQERLWNKKIGSEVQYLQAKANKEGLEQRMAAVKEQYRLTKIIAPISGSVDQIIIKENQATAAGFGTIRVVKLSELKITAKLSEIYQGTVKKGDPVTVQLPLSNSAFATTVTSVGQVVDQKSRTFGIELDVPKSIENIIPNMLVKLDINDYTNDAAFTVPLRAIQKTADKVFLFVAHNPENSNDENWVVEKRFVTPGKLHDNNIEISKGLSNGEYVVIAGHQDLADNQKVKRAK